MKIEAFIFDIGNVLLHFDYDKARAALRAAGAPEPEVGVVEALGYRYERGEVSSDIFLHELSEIFGHVASEGLLVQAWQEIFEPNQPMWEVVEKLHGRYPLYLLSNTNALQHDYIAARYAVLARFADGVYSYRAGMMKPEPEIFTKAIAQFGVNPSVTVYFDDLAPNVAAAETAGLRAFQYHPASHAACLEWLRDCGVQCV
jgi:putative hydrolase of the HAD superfamily